MESRALASPWMHLQKCPSVNVLICHCWMDGSSSEVKGKVKSLIKMALDPSSVVMDLFQAWGLVMKCPVKAGDEDICDPGLRFCLYSFFCHSVLKSDLDFVKLSQLWDDVIPLLPQSDLLSNNCTSQRVYSFYNPAICSRLIVYLTKHNMTCFSTIYSLEVNRVGRVLCWHWRLLP